MHTFARDQQVPWVEFTKGQRKGDIAHEHLARFARDEGVLFIRRAQEKTGLFRTEKRRNAEGAAYPWIVRSTGMVNHFYVYAVDAEFGPFFLKFCSYFPYNARLCINGHEWAKRQAAKAGIGFSALDNGFATCEDPVALPPSIPPVPRQWSPGWRWGRDDQNDQPPVPPMPPMPPRPEVNRHHGRCDGYPRRRASPWSVNIWLAAARGRAGASVSA
jgi:hypothetical protein